MYMGSVLSDMSFVITNWTIIKMNCIEEAALRTTREEKK